MLCSARYHPLFPKFTQQSHTEALNTQSPTFLGMAHMGGTTLPSRIRMESDKIRDRIRVSSLTIPETCQATCCLQGSLFPEASSTSPAKTLAPRGSIRAGDACSQLLKLRGHHCSPFLPSFLLLQSSEPFLPDFVTLLRQHGGDSPPSSLLPYPTAFLLLLPAFSVPAWLQSELTAEKFRQG